MRFTRSLLSLFVGTIAALAFAAPAGAAGADRIKAACWTAGTAKVIPPMPFTGGTGSYWYATLAFSCIAVEISKGTFGSVSLVNLEVNSPGTYTNLVCGSGKLVSSPNGAVVESADIIEIVGLWKTDTVAEWQAVANDLDYVIEFVSGAGLLKWTDTAAGKLSVDLPKFLTSGPSGFPGGYALILADPSKSSPFPNACTKAFQVIAHLTLDWAPNNPIV